MKNLGKLLSSVKNCITSREAALRHICAHYTTRRTGLLLAVSAICAVCVCGCGTKEPVSRTGLFFDTYVTITLYDKDAPPALLDACFERTAYFEQCFSPTLEGSDIRKINESGGSPVTVHPETAALISAALSYCELSEGAIDITVEPISRLWDFSSTGLSEGSHAVPDENSIASLLPHVDYKKVDVSGNTVTLSDPDAQISLGFIAKGYIADDLKSYLKSEGIEHALINLGGNILAIGAKPDGSPFRVGVQRPFDRQGVSIAACDIHDKSLVSSGVYERYFEQDGRLYHHILDTATGWPVENELYGVTILSDSSAVGDALSTVCFTMGLKEGMALIESLEGVEALFITKDYELHKSSHCTFTFPASTSR